MNTEEPNTRSTMRPTGQRQGLRFKLAEQWALEASFGAPVIAREVRPDGLTRENVTALGVQYRF